MDVQRIRIGQMQMRRRLFDRRHVVEPGERGVRRVQIAARLGHRDVAQRRVGLHARTTPCHSSPCPPVTWLGHPRTRAAADADRPEPRQIGNIELIQPNASAPPSADPPLARSSRRYPGFSTPPPRVRASIQMHLGRVVIASGVPDRATTPLRSGTSPCPIRTDPAPKLGPASMLKRHERRIERDRRSERNRHIQRWPETPGSAAVPVSAAGRNGVSRTSQPAVAARIRDRASAATAACSPPAASGPCSEAMDAPRGCAHQIDVQARGAPSSVPIRDRGTSRRCRENAPAGSGPATLASVRDRRWRDAQAARATAPAGRPLRSSPSASAVRPGPNPG